MDEATHGQEGGPRRVLLDACPGCGAAGGAVELAAGDGIGILRCGGCGLRHATACYDTAFLADDFYAGRAGASRGSADAFARDRKRRSLGLYDRLDGGRLGHPAPGAKALDVGCLGGLFLDVLAEAGYVTEGIERSGAAAAEAGRRHRVHHLDLEADRAALDALGRDYALVTFTHVLEHLRRPADALGWARERLAPGGAVLVEVPNWDDAARRLWGRRYRPLELGDHLSFFDRDTLAAVARRAGLAPQAVWSEPQGATLLMPSVLTALDLAKSLRARRRPDGVAGTRIDAGGAPGRLKTRVLEALDRLDPLLERAAGRGARWGANLVALLRPA